MTVPPIPQTLAAFAQHRGIDISAWAERGKLDLRIDGRKRIKVHPGRRPNDLVLETRVRALPHESKDCEALLARVMLHVTAGAAEQVGVAVVSADGRQLLLQALLDATDAELFERGLETFLNEMDRWNAVAGVEHP